MKTTVKIEIDNEQIRNALQTAVDAGHTFGIGYWAANLEWNAEGNILAWLHEHNDTRDEKQWKYHVLDIERGLHLTLLNPPSGFGGQFEIREDEIECDGPGADYFIQMCVFGEQKYG